MTTEKQRLLDEIAQLKDQVRKIDLDSRSVFGRNLLTWRKRQGFSQRTLADAVCVTRVTIAHIELGDSNTSLPTLMRLCAALAVTPNDLLLDRKPRTTPTLEIQ